MTFKEIMDQAVAVLHHPPNTQADQADRVSIVLELTGPCRHWRFRRPCTTR
jgi:hypothetical protein